MAHCIYCGTPNPEGASFCLSCGQVLYHEPKAIPDVPTRGTRDWLVPVGIVGAVVLIFLVLLGMLSKNARGSAASRQQIARSTAAVLTIVGYDGAGNPEAQGSGFILTGGGLGATNYHVLDGARIASAECCNGRKFQIKSIEGVDVNKDLVVFQLQEQGANDLPSGLPSVVLETIGDTTVGEKVITIGSPRGLENTVSDGIISAIRSDRSVRYLQITAPISPGSSGGPVLNEDGRVIGVATMQLKDGQNLNFAVSAEYLQYLINQHLQISVADLTPPGKVEQAETESSANTVDQVNNQERGQRNPGPFTGQFAGTVHNETANLSAGFALFVEDKNGNLRGCLAVLPPLGGSGPVEGAASSSDVSFVAASNGEKITFVGERDQSSVSGTYVVEKGNGNQEDGRFSATRTKILKKGTQMDFRDCPTDADLK